MKHGVVKFPKPSISRYVREQQTQTGDLLYDDDDDDDFVWGDYSTSSDINQPVEGPVQSEPVQGDPVSEPVVGRYPKRERKPPEYLADYATGNNFEDDSNDDQIMSTIDYCYRVCAFPQNYQEAVEPAESEYWRNAMKEEMNSVKESNTFTLTTLPKGRKLLGGRWVYTFKENPNGSRVYKARYVAKGYSQVKDEEYQDTFAPTANFTSVRTVMQLAAHNNLILHQMDVKTAYLNAPIDCEIFMEQPEGFEIPSNSEDVLVCKLNKSLYGLKQSGRNWNGMLHNHLCENHFEQSGVDNCVYVRHVDDKMIVIVIWVDDLIIGASTDLLLCETNNMLKDKLKMKDLGKLSHFLGVDFEQGDGYVKISQKEYIHKVLERYGMSDCKPRYTPSEPKIDCIEGEPVDSKTYREAIGCLMYAMICTRPDICWIITKLSQYVTKPLK